MQLQCHYEAQHLINMTSSLHAATSSFVFPQTITSTLIDEPKILCPGEDITFTCVTRGSPIIAWQSDEYIGEGGTQLEFATFNNQGDTDSSSVNPDTVATLTRNSNEDGVQVLESKLRVITSAEFPDASVTCVHVGTGIKNTTRFHVLGMCACILQYSSSCYI